MTGIRLQARPRLPATLGEARRQPGGSALSVAARGVAWVGAGNVVSQLSWFGSLFLIAHLVRPAAFGSVTIAMVMVQVAWLVVGSGTRGSFVVSPTLTRGQVWYGLAINVGTGLGIGALVALVGAPAIHAIAPGADATVVRVLAFSITLFGFSIVPLAILQREVQFRRHASANAVAAMLASTIAVAAAVLGAGVWALVVRQVLFQALLAGLAWAWAWRLLPPPGTPRRTGSRHPTRPRNAGLFFGLGIVYFVALNVDVVIVGHLTDVTRLGLYSLAFTIAFAPMTQFAWQIGKVMVPTAARTDPSRLGAQAARAVQITAAILLPLVPPAIALAPVLLPRLLGPAWVEMVLPFQILLVAGIAHAVLAILKDFLVGSGSVGFCVRTEAIWLLVMGVGLYAGFRVAGLAGVAAAHVLLVIPLVTVYAIWGSRRLRSSAGRLCGSLRGVVAALAAESLATVLAIVFLRAAGAPAGAAGAAGAATGLGVALVVMWRSPSSPLTGLLRALTARARPRVPA